MTSRLLPHIVELHQLPNTPCPYLAQLDLIEVLAVQAETHLKVLALVLRPQAHGIRRQDGLHPAPPHCFLHIVLTLEKEIESLLIIGDMLSSWYGGNFGGVCKALLLHIGKVILNCNKGKCISSTFKQCNTCQQKIHTCSGDRRNNKITALGGKACSGNRPMIEIQ